MNKYRRIEVTALRRRLTVVSGEWPGEALDSLTAQTDDEVSLNDTEVCEPVPTDSPEGQLILVEAVRSLERRLSPEALAMLRDSSEHPHAQTEEFIPATEKGLGP